MIKGTQCDVGQNPELLAVVSLFSLGKGCWAHEYLSSQGATRALWKITLW